MPEKQWRREPLPPGWGAMRQETLEKADWRCEMMMPGGGRCNLRATDVDHYGEPWEHDKRRALCRTHHASRTGRQGGTAFRRRQGGGLPTQPRKRPEETHPLLGQASIS